MTDEPLENPYAAPQSALGATPKPKLIRTDKFNRKMAFWVSICLSVVLCLLLLPRIETDRTLPYSIWDDVVKVTIAVFVSTFVGIFIGANSGSQEPVIEEDEAAIQDQSE